MAFQKGQSGNPGGRPKEIKEIQELARKHCPAAIARLAKVLSKGKSDSAVVAAAIALLDRAYGKAPQAIAMSGPDGGPIETKELSDLDAVRRINFLLRKAANAPPKEKP